MAYEYGSGNQNFSLANPLRVHNYFLVGSAAIAGLTGLYLLFSARSALQGNEHVRMTGTLVVAFVILVVAGRLLYRVASQLRFYFGRGRPASLAPMLDPDKFGTSPAADRYIKESLRQQALEYAEPASPLSGLLYSLIPNLVYAPPPVRLFAERQFKAGAFTLSIIIGLLIALVFSAGSSSPSTASISRWVALIYLAVAAPSLWRSSSDKSVGPGETDSVSIPAAVGFLIFSVIGPTAISLAFSHVPAPPLDISPVMVIVLLVLALTLHGLFAAAIARHALPPPTTSVSVQQDTWNLSCNPALISAELLRAMQDGWWEKIPNRRYCRIDADIDLNHRSGSFHGSLIEESQPVPFAMNGAQGDRSFSSGDPQLVTAINIYGICMVVVAAISCIWLAGLFDTSMLQVVPLVAYACFFWIVAISAFDVARALALRFDFKSTLYWMEYEGNYTAAEVAQGNRYQSTIHSSSQVVQVEGMTFRLWVAEAHSITFGKDAQRYIYSLVGLPDVAFGLAKRLKDFVTNQSSLLSLGSRSDQERMRAVAQMNTQETAIPTLTHDPRSTPGKIDIPPDMPTRPIDQP